MGLPFAEDLGLVHSKDTRRLLIACASRSRGSDTLATTGTCTYGALHKLTQVHTHTHAQIFLNFKM